MCEIFRRQPDALEQAAEQIRAQTQAQVRSVAALYPRLFGRRSFENGVNVGQRRVDAGDGDGEADGQDYGEDQPGQQEVGKGTGKDDGRPFTHRLMVEGLGAILFGQFLLFAAAAQAIRKARRANVLAPLALAALLAIVHEMGEQRRALQAEHAMAAPGDAQRREE